MIFPILTLLSAFSLAAVAAWFSIIGIMTIYAGAPMYAVIMGIVSECSKLITASWLYRNWGHATWMLKAPLLVFLAALMLITSIGVFGFLSKAHLDQTSATLDTGPRIEQLSYQISKEEEIIADNDKVIAQLDQTVDALTQSQRIRGRDGSIAVRQGQAAQRQQLRDDSAEARQRIDVLNKEKFALESEIRKLELEVGPIRYIAELMYGSGGDESDNIAAAIRIFTLLITLTLDPLAVTLLIAANYTLMRIRNEKEKIVNAPPDKREIGQSEAKNHKEASDTDNTTGKDSSVEFTERFSARTASTSIPSVQVPQVPLPEIIQSMELLDEEKEKILDRSRDQYGADYSAPRAVEEIGPRDVADMASELARSRTSPQDIRQDRSAGSQEEIAVDEHDLLYKFLGTGNVFPVPAAKTPTVTPISYPGEPDDGEKKHPWAQQDYVLRELIGNEPHFVPKKVIDTTTVTDNTQQPPAEADKYPKALSWLTEFRGK